MSSVTKNVLITGLLVSLLTVCATNIAGRKQVMLVSESEAIQASKQAYNDMLVPLQNEGKIDNNPAMVRRVNEITIITNTRVIVLSH